MPRNKPPENALAKPKILEELWHMEQYRGINQKTKVMTKITNKKIIFR